MDRQIDRQTSRHPFGQWSEKHPWLLSPVKWGLVTWSTSKELPRSQELFPTGSLHEHFHLAIWLHLGHPSCHPAHMHSWAIHEVCQKESSQASHPHSIPQPSLFQQHQPAASTTGCHWLSMRRTQIHACLHNTANKDTTIRTELPQACTTPRQCSEDNQALMINRFYLFQRQNNQGYQYRGTPTTKKTQYIVMSSFFHSCKQEHH